MSNEAAEEILATDLNASAKETAQEAEVTETEDQGDRVASVSSGSVLLVFTEGNVLTTRSRKLEEKNSTTTTTTREGSSTRIGEKVVSKCTSKDEKLRESLTKLEHDGASCISSMGDICRICHMGSFPAQPGSRPMWEWQNRGAQESRRMDSQISTLSSYAYLGPLTSACKCRGTVGLIHVECLERWLTESGHTRCELCGHRYATKRVPRHGIFRSLVIWFNTVIATRQMLLDILYLVVTTPLALFSCYVCALALKMLVESGFQDIPWMIIAMLPTCSLTLVAYWGWLITLGRYISRLHGRRWRRFWRNNFVVRLLPENANNNIYEDNTEDVRERTEYRIARRNYYEENDFTFGRLPDDEAEDFIQIM